MSNKRIVLIIMCSLLAVMTVLMIVVFSQFVPFLNMLRPQKKPVIQVPSTSLTVPPTSTTPPTTAKPQPTLPSQPPIVTNPGHVHDFQFTKTIEATCESPGYTLYTCSCNTMDMRDVTEALGHSYGTGIKFVSCTEECYTEYTCIRCDHKDRQNVSEAPGHDWKTVKIEEPTCTEDGYELHRCGRCNEEKQENMTPAPGHTDFDWVESRTPGVGEPGEEVRQCSVCQFRETRGCVMSVTGVEPQDLGDRIEYIIHVGTTDTPHALQYSVKDYSKADLNIEYTVDGLLITNTEDPTKQILLAPLKNESVTIDSDGAPSGNIPTVPPTQPSTSTATQPSTPTGTQPNTSISTRPSSSTSVQPTTPTVTQPAISTGTQPTVPATTQPTVPATTQPTVPTETLPTATTETLPTATTETE